jgi:hypothetical protein
MRLSFTRAETFLLLACAALCVVALFGPSLAQPPHAHDFADGRALWGIPCTFDVLSNLPFAIAGCWGLAVLQRVPQHALPGAQRACARLFFVGLLVTAAGSSWYHLAPDDLGLAIDRAAMSVAFAGLLGLLAATRVSDRAGRALAATLLLLAPASVALWYATGNVLPWAVVQFGGIPLLLLAAATATAPREGALPVRWSLVLLAYAVAKWLELNDQVIFAATGELLSGHTLKHVAAAFAAWPVLAVVAAARSGQNAANEAAVIVFGDVRG